MLYITRLAHARIAWKVEGASLALSGVDVGVSARVCRRIECARRVPTGWWVLQGPGRSRSLLPSPKPQFRHYDCFITRTAFGRSFSF
eukprot:6053026-Pleurochrysis_carterae.AAC.2